MELNQVHQKGIEYSLAINEAIVEFLNNADSHIFKEIQEDEDNLKAFIFAFSVIVPMKMLNRISRENYDALGFNHLINKLIFELCQSEKEED